MLDTKALQTPIAKERFTAGHVTSAPAIVQVTRKIRTWVMVLALKRQAVASSECGDKFLPLLGLSVGKKM